MDIPFILSKEHPLHRLLLQQLLVLLLLVLQLPFHLEEEPELEVECQIFNRCKIK